MTDDWSPPTSDVALRVGPVDAPDRYELLSERAGGTEGLLYQGRFQAPDAGTLVVAIKALRGTDDARQLDRWLANRALLRTLHHPHVVRYLDHFVGAPPHRVGAGAGVGAAAVDPPTTFYEVMEWVDGVTLEQLVREQRLDGPARWRLVEQLADAVDSLHGGTNAVLHRDIKPANVVVHPTRGAVLVDFGLARAEQAHTTRQAAGTEGYRAPELVHEGRQPSRESDRWSFAATAHFALTGRPPSVTTPALVGDAAAGAFVQALDPDPDKRPTSMVAWSREVGAALMPAPPAPSSRARWPVVAAAGVAAAVVVAVLALVLQRDRPKNTPLVAPTTLAATAVTAAPSSGPTTTATGLPAANDALFPAVPGATWTALPDSLGAQMNLLLAGVDPSHTYTKAAELRYLQRGGRQLSVVRYELQDSALDPTVFREKFIKTFLFTTFTSRSVGDSEIYESDGTAGHFAVFGGRDKACWIVIDSDAAASYDAAVAILNVVGGIAR